MELGEDGTLGDVAVLQAIVDECTLALHQRDLDDLPPFQGRNSTAENVARHVYDQVGQRIQSDRITGWCVRVWESPLVWASFDGGHG
jgi:6-pyruvoyltetrahydropterin/6-carboxytetrahydropterin synthase